MLRIQEELVRATKQIVERLKRRERAGEGVSFAMLQAGESIGRACHVGFLAAISARGLAAKSRSFSET